MDVVVKNVTKEYEKALQKKHRIYAIFSLVIAAAIVIFCFLPFAYIKEYTIGNSFNILFGFLKDAFTKERTSYFYLTYFAIFAIVILAFGLYYLIIGLIFLKKPVDTGPLYINKKDESLLFTPKYICKHVMRFIVLLFFCIAIIWMTNAIAEKYGFTFTLNWYIIVLFAATWVRSVICDRITLIYDEKGALTKKEILETTKQKQKKKLTKEERKLIKKTSGIDPVATVNHMNIVAIIFVVIACSAFGLSTYYTGMFGGYNTLGFNSVAGWVVSPVDEDLLRFDILTLYGGNNRLVCEQGFGDYYIGLEFKNNGQYEDNTKTFTFYGDAYRYNCVKVKELTEERDSLWPEDDTEKAMEKYLSKIEKMTSSINAMKKIVDDKKAPYERVAFVNGYMVDLQYNSTGVDTVKWGQKTNVISSLIFREKITLTDKYCKNKKSMDRFAVGTDFSKELIVARVQYSDGSVRISKITPTNVEELNNASAGKHLLKWTNSWGEYETTIELYNQ